MKAVEIRPIHAGGVIPTMGGGINMAPHIDSARVAALNYQWSSGSGNTVVMIASRDAKQKVAIGLSAHRMDIAHGIRR